MTSGERDFLIHRLDEARSQIKELLPKVDPTKEIFPGWTIKEMLSHITGWDDATSDSLRAHVAGRAPATPAGHGWDEYNSRTVTSHASLDYQQVLKECELTRQSLRTIILEMPEEKFLEPLIVPWGEKGTVTGLIEAFVGHEEEHARDIREWLGNASGPLTRKGS